MTNHKQTDQYFKNFHYQRFFAVWVFAEWFQITWVAHTLGVGKGDPCGCRAVHWIHGRLRMLQGQMHEIYVGLHLQLADSTGYTQN